jgi:hypothetical protein
MALFFIGGSVSRDILACKQFNYVTARLSVRDPLRCFPNLRAGGLVKLLDARRGLREGFGV